MKQQNNVRTVKLQPKYRQSQEHFRQTGVNKNVPWLNVSGNWLEDAGFKAGDYVNISVGKNELIVRKVRATGSR